MRARVVKLGNDVFHFRPGIKLGHVYLCDPVTISDVSICGNFHCTRPEHQSKGILCKDPNDPNDPWGMVPVDLLEMEPQ